MGIGIFKQPQAPTGTEQPVIAGIPPVAIGDGCQGFLDRTTLTKIAAQQVVVSEQQIAQALQRLISNSNARAGYSMGIPVPTPVLG